jgi:beta-glucosidase
MTRAPARLPPHRRADLPVAARVADLLPRMTVAEKAGLLFHAMIDIGDDGRLADVDPTEGLLSASDMVLHRSMNHFNLVGTASPGELARWHNRLQELAGATRLGIPVTLSTDPRHGSSSQPLTSLLAGPFSHWPEPLGLAATRDARLVERFAEVARQEYRAVGIRLALHPQLDLATEPRWPRIVGTFGEDTGLVAELGRAYVRGFQGRRLGPHSVATMVKHFPGGGPQKDGEDPHFPYGREQVYPGNRFAEHLAPFLAAIDAGTAALMPYYGVPVGLPLDEVGFGFNRALLTGLLRDDLRFDGVICTDWGLLTQIEYRGEVLPARAWGLDHVDPSGRILAALYAGVDQFGGEAQPDLVVDLVRDGRLVEKRLDRSAARLLRDKFVLGLFDDPYVDPDAAAATVGRAEFQAEGRAAQRASVTLLRNAPAGSPARLPLRPGVSVYVDGLPSEAVRPYALPVSDPADADVALLRLEAPHECRPGAVESFFRAGSLAFPSDEIARVRAIAGSVPAIVDVYLDRPAVLTEVDTAAAALVVSFGMDDGPLLDVLFGFDEPRGRLPVDLPRSMAAVQASRADVPFDTREPLYRCGHGLTYAD